MDQNEKACLVPLIIMVTGTLEGVIVGMVIWLCLNTAVWDPIKAALLAAMVYYLLNEVGSEFMTTHVFEKIATGE